MKLNKLVFATVFVFGAFSSALAQSDTISEPNVKEYAKESSNEFSCEANRCEVFGRNLRNADGTEMGAFVVRDTTKSEIEDGKKTEILERRITKDNMPEPGFDSESYAKAMRKQEAKKESK